MRIHQHLQTQSPPFTLRFLTKVFLTRSIFYNSLYAMNPLFFLIHFPFSIFNKRWGLIMASLAFVRPPIVLFFFFFLEVIESRF